MESIKTSRGVISPSLIVSAEACCEQNIDIVYLDGSAIKEEDLGKVVVLVDGQHRHAAIMKLNEQLEEGETPYENHLYFPINDGCSIITILKEANVATSVWKSSDYFNAIINEKRDSDAVLEKLSWVKNLIDNRFSSETAAWLWGAFEGGRLPSKAQFNKADGSDEERNKIFKIGRFQFGKLIYEKMEALFGAKFVGRKAIPEFFIEKMEDLINAGSTTVTAATDTLSHFIKISFTAEVVKEIAAYKSIKGGASRDSQIQAKFKELYAAFENSSVAAA